jgi:hypothetical protein
MYTFFKVRVEKYEQNIIESDFLALWLYFALLGLIADFESINYKLQ